MLFVIQLLSVCTIDQQQCSHRVSKKYMNVCNIVNILYFPHRTPAMELANARNGDQVQPLRYQWPLQSDIPLTQAISKVQ